MVQRKLSIGSMKYISKIREKGMEAIQEENTNLFYAYLRKIYIFT